MTNLPPEFEIAVFAKGTRTNGIASERTSWDAAVYMVSVLKIARWVNNRRNSIQMLCEQFDAKMRDTSCQMGPSVTFRAACGSRRDRAIVQGWAALLVGRAA